MSARLDIVDVTVTFGTRAVLDGVSLTIEPAEIVALLGPSGSGKSTLLRVVAGLVPVDRGTVGIDGTDITMRVTHERGVGMVFQDDQLFTHLDVLGNVEFGLRVRGDSPSSRSRRSAALLQLVGLAGFDRRRVTDLSGGEAKRVALARSLAPSPMVLLLDEPLSGLDRELHDRLLEDLSDIMRAERTTSLVVTHDVEEAAAIADRVVTLADLTG